jgi:Flp pilus assembly pilin Flp
VGFRFTYGESMRPTPRQTQSAQSLVEFSLLLALVAVVAIAGLIVFGGTVSSMMSTLAHTVASNLGPA